MVGAALRAADGSLFTGCNVENASYGISMCAERTALFKAVSQGAHSFSAIAVVSENGVTPCGACRQALAEFARGLPVIVGDASGRWQLHDLTDLLPHAFVPQDWLPRTIPHRARGPPGHPASKNGRHEKLTLRLCMLPKASKATPFASILPIRQPQSLATITGTGGAAFRSPTPYDEP